MQLRTSNFNQQVKKLDQERSWIQRQFIELDEAILQGKGSPGILEAARSLVSYLLLHFTHQEQFSRRIPGVLAAEPRGAWKERLTELLQLDAALVEGEVYAALRLRGFCRAWLHPHGGEFQPTPWEARPRPKTAQA